MRWRCRVVSRDRAPDDLSHVGGFVGAGGTSFTTSGRSSMSSSHCSPECSRPTNAPPPAPSFASATSSAAAVAPPVDRDCAAEAGPREPPSPISAVSGPGSRNGTANRGPASVAALESAFSAGPSPGGADDALSHDGIRSGREVDPDWDSVHSARLLRASLPSRACMMTTIASMGLRRAPARCARPRPAGPLRLEVASLEAAVRWTSS